MFHVPIAGILLTVLALIGIVVSLRGHREHLRWIVPFALAAAMCTPWTTSYSKPTAGGMMFVMDIIRFPLWMILSLIAFGICMLALILKNQAKRIKPDTLISEENAWPPAPSSKPLRRGDGK